MSPARKPGPLLIIFGGLPGTGKTTLSRALVGLYQATYLRIDTIEQAMGKQPIGEEGYLIAYAVAEDNLRLGRTVIADSVNPCAESRDAWVAVAQRANAHAAEVETVCTDPETHRERVETRVGDIAGLKLPTWEKVLARDYQPWLRAHIVLDTAGRTVAQSVEALHKLLSTESRAPDSI